MDTNFAFRKVQIKAFQPCGTLADLYLPRLSRVHILVSKSTKPKYAFFTTKQKLLVVMPTEKCFKRFYKNNL